MINPSLDSLLEKVDSKYTLVVAAAKRARQLMNEEQAHTNSRSKKPVSIALEEISQDKIKIERLRQGKNKNSG